MLLLHVVTVYRYFNIYIIISFLFSVLNIKSANCRRYADPNFTVNDATVACL